jgi:hypothetical protein
MHYTPDSPASGRNADPRTGTAARAISAVRSALPAAFASVRWLLTIMVPVSLAVTLLNYSGVIRIVSDFLDPAFRAVGLPGSSAFVFLTSVVLNIYSAIAVISTLGFTIREVTILALMCLISHNFFVELAVQKRTGSALLRMVALRLGMSFAGALVLNALLPAAPAAAADQAVNAAASAGFGTLLAGWAADTFFLVLKVSLIVTGLMILQNILKEFGVIGLLSRAFSPLLRLLGLPGQTTFLWIVANVIGLAYGAAVMFEETDSGKLRKTDADLLNHHTAVNHSMLEDTLLFAAIGVPALWIMVPRVVLAAAAVWARRFELYLRGRRQAAT